MGNCLNEQGNTHLNQINGFLALYIMAKITVKHKYGDDVCCNGVPCRVTGIIIRGKQRAYELGYLDNNGNPAGCTAQECEITVNKNEKLGFKKEK